MTDKYAALKQAARIVAVGDWLYHDRQKLEHVGGGFLAIDGKESVFCLNSAVGGIKKGNDVVKYIAAANPSTVLSLLDELEAADALNKHLELAIRKAEGCSEALRRKTEAAEKRIAELEARAFNPAILDVIAERQRQQSVEGWTPAHDDKHDNNEMAFAASCYAFHSAAASWDFEDDGTPYDIHQAPKNWPWDSRWWKPTSPRRDLVKAGALIIAEIERIDRATGIRIKGE
ncbi:ead/Ea22-like family protein [Escherichia coli]|uniref:ead/Ea22-like family protein n=1 Tax=Escherichia coli TaxID=562 RepID=UPI0028E0C912|nr:ead/Ea22-like family protein [Escherichia coli]MDT9357156.1 ead/Ea22-like family protein [Escherichia coli]MDT9370667.1 ead/Ea22-like family protein [Escherichia coli]